MSEQTIREAERIFPALLLIARQNAPAWCHAFDADEGGNHWDTPPNDDRNVLVFRNGHVSINDHEGRKGGGWGIGIGFYDNTIGGWRVGGRVVSDITHWMELPAAPTPAARDEVPDAP